LQLAIGAFYEIPDNECMGIFGVKIWQKAMFII